MQAERAAGAEVVMAEAGEMTCTNSQGLAVPGLVFVAREERSDGGEGADTLERFCERNAG